MAYVTLAAVALTRGQSLLSYALWIATIGLMVNAIVLAILAHGGGKGSPLGFAVAAFLYLAGVLFVYDAMPSTQLVEYRFGVNDEPSASLKRLAYQGTPISAGFSLNQANRAAQMERRLLSRLWLYNTRGAAHAIGVMLSGLIGAALGALAARHASVGADRE
jgi:Co/Zn/Cd efflux system component